MALTQEQWANWRKHIDHTVAVMGQWVGLLNGDYEPVADLPPLIDLQSPRTRLASAEQTATMPAATPQGLPHAVIDYLVDEGFGKLDEASRLVPNMKRSWFVAVQRPGGEKGRFVYRVTFPNLGVEGADISTLRVESVDLNEMLESWPCPSVPAIWGHEPIRAWEQDAGGVYDKPYRYAPIEMATVARGYTAHGPAEATIQTLIQESLDAGNRVKQWHRPHMVVDRTASGRPSPVAAIRRDDRTVWDTIAEPARLAGVNVWVQMWWPGDAPFPVRYESAGSIIETSWNSPTQPIAVVKVVQGGA